MAEPDYERRESSIVGSLGSFARFGVHEWGLTPAIFDRFLRIRSTYFQREIDAVSEAAGLYQRMGNHEEAAATACQAAELQRLQQEPPEYGDDFVAGLSRLDAYLFYGISIYAQLCDGLREKGLDHASSLYVVAEGDTPLLSLTGNPYIRERNDEQLNAERLVRQYLETENFQLPLNDQGLMPPGVLDTILLAYVSEVIGESYLGMVVGERDAHVLQGLTFHKLFDLPADTRRIFVYSGSGFEEAHQKYPLVPFELADLLSSERVFISCSPQEVEQTLLAVVSVVGDSGEDDVDELPVPRLPGRVAAARTSMPLTSMPY